MVVYVIVALLVALLYAFVIGRYNLIDESDDALTYLVACLGGAFWLFSLPLAILATAAYFAVTFGRKKAKAASED